MMMQARGFDSGNSVKSSLVFEYELCRKHFLMNYRVPCTVL